MESGKLEIGKISYHERNYTVYWEILTKLVWVKDENNHFTNIGEAKAYSKNKVIECAIEMLKLSGA